MAQGFKGFSQQGLNFLPEVVKLNDKTWFDEHREVYDNGLLLPFRQLVEALTPTMLLIDDSFEIRPSVGKTISRIHRDTRFSHDKSRYRSRLWLTFKRLSKDWKESPAYFFEISPDSYRYGLGYYSAPKQKMDLFRDQIMQDTKAFEKVIKCCKAPFELVGESYKRSLNKTLPPPIANWYNRKNFAVMVTSYQVENLFDKTLTHELSQAFTKLIPLYHYLMKIEANSH